MCVYACACLHIRVFDYTIVMMVALHTLVSKVWDARVSVCVCLHVCVSGCAFENISPGTFIFTDVPQFGKF